MRVYEVDYDVNAYQQLLVSGESDFRWVLKLRGLRTEDWEVPAMYIENRQRPAPDFWSAEGQLAFSPDLRVLPTDVYTHLETAGQWLPIKIEDGPKLVIVNVTEVVNAMDIQNTRWATTDNGHHIYVDQKPGSFVFRPDRFGVSSIFKIPQNNYTQILCFERSGDPAEEFKAAVEHEKLKGLEFMLLWEG